MINYKAIKRQNPQNKGEYKWYPSIVLTNPMLLDELAEAIALNCTVTAHDIKAVLSAMQEQIIFALRQQNYSTWPKRSYSSARSMRTE